MSTESITKSIELLGQIIQKTPLNQKLLSRPPFRYIHDIFSEIIKTSGFFEGLYTEEEMMSENVKVSPNDFIIKQDKETKLSYLNKMIKALGKSFFS